VKTILIGLWPSITRASAAQGATLAQSCVIGRAANGALHRRKATSAAGWRVVNEPSVPQRARAGCRVTAD